MKQILCLGADPWQNSPTRTQRFLSSFQDVRILYFYPDEHAAASDHGQQVASNISVFPLSELPNPARKRFRMGQLTRTRVLRRMLQIIESHGFRTPLLWVCSPGFESLTDELPHIGLIYDCDRDWSHLPIESESRLTCRADIVLAASIGLKAHLAPCNHQIIVVPNGIHFPRYDAVKTNDFLCPPDLAACSTPVFGYVGTVWSNLNLTPVEAAAAAHPDWSFVFIGKVSKKNPYLPAMASHANVHFLGVRSPEDVPPYLRHLTAGIMLLRDGQEDNDILSPRVFEYFAQGLPVVAMYHHLQKEAYPTLIDSAYSLPRFVEMCEKVVAGDPVEKKVQRHEIASKSDWSLRCQAVKDAVQDSRLLDQLDLQHTTDDASKWFK